MERHNGQKYCFIWNACFEPQPTASTHTIKFMFILLWYIANQLDQPYANIVHSYSTFLHIDANCIFMSGGFFLCHSKYRSSSPTAKRLHACLLFIYMLAAYRIKSYSGDVGWGCVSFIACRVKSVDVSSAVVYVVTIQWMWITYGI